MLGTMLGYQEERATVTALMQRVAEWKNNSWWCADCQNTVPRGETQRRYKLTEPEGAQRASERL